MLRGKNQDTHTILKKQAEISYSLGNAYIDGKAIKKSKESGESWGCVCGDAQKRILGCAILECLLNNFSLNSPYVFHAISVCIFHNLKKGVDRNRLGGGSGVCSRQRAKAGGGVHAELRDLQTQWGDVVRNDKSDGSRQEAPTEGGAS